MTLFDKLIELISVDHQSTLPSPQIYQKIINLGKILIKKATINQTYLRTIRIKLIKKFRYLSISSTETLIQFISHIIITKVIQKIKTLYRLTISLHTYFSSSTI